MLTPDEAQALVRHHGSKAAAARAAGVGHATFYYWLDPEKQKAKMRRLRAGDYGQAELARQRAAYARNPEAKRERGRAAYAANIEERRAKASERYRQPGNARRRIFWRWKRQSDARIRNRAGDNPDSLLLPGAPTIGGKH